MLGNGRNRRPQLTLPAAAAVLFSLLCVVAAQAPVSCEQELQAAMDAGNCSQTACPTACLTALSQVPVSCVFSANSNLSAYVDGAASVQRLRANLAECGLQHYVAVNASSEFADANPSNGADLIVKYLVGICLGAVLMSVVFIILLAAPMLLSRALGAPAVLVVKGRHAVQQGKAAYDTGRAKLAGASWVGAAHGQWNAAVEKLGGHRTDSKGGTALAVESGAVDGGLVGAGTDGGGHDSGETGPLAEQGADHSISPAAGLPSSPPETEVAVSGPSENGRRASVEGATRAAASATAGAARRAGRGAGEVAAYMGGAAADAMAGLQRSVVEVSPASEQPAARLAPSADLSGGKNLTAPLPAVTDETGLGGASSSQQLLLSQAAPGKGTAARTAFVVWAVLAGALYVAALALLIVGTDQFVNNSVASFILDLTGSDSVLTAIQWLIIGCLIITGVCDLAAIWIVMAANKTGFMFGRRRLRNWLHSGWVDRHAYKIHVVVAGLVTLVLSVACILFGLGFIVTLMQVVVRTFCSEIASLSVNGVSVADVCIDVPITDAPVCGWSAIDLCYSISGMSVLTLVLGAALLLWSHIIWFTLLLLSMWRFMSWKVVYSSGGIESGGGSGDGTVGAAGAGSMGAVAPEGGQPLAASEEHTFIKTGVEADALEGARSGSGEPLKGED